MSRTVVACAVRTAPRKLPPELMALVKPEFSVSIIDIVVGIHRQRVSMCRSEAAKTSL